MKQPHFSNKRKHKTQRLGGTPNTPRPPRPNIIKTQKSNPVSRRQRKSPSPSNSKSPSPIEQPKFSPHSPLGERPALNRYRRPQTQRLLNKAKDDLKQIIESRMSNRTRKLRGAITTAKTAVNAFDENLPVAKPTNYQFGQYKEDSPINSDEARNMEERIAFFKEQEKAQEEGFKEQASQILKEAIDSVKGDIEKQMQVYKIVKHIEKLFSEIREFDTEISVLEENRNTKYETVRDLGFEIAGMEQEMQFTYATDPEILKQISNYKNEIPKLQTKIDKLMRQIEQLDSKIRVATEERDKLYKHMERQNTKLEKLTNFVDQENKNDIIGLGNTFDHDADSDNDDLSDIFGLE